MTVENIIHSLEELERQVEKSPSFIPGADVWVVERDAEGIACEVSGYMFLAEVAGFIIASSYINDLESIEDTLAYHAEKTVENYDTDLAVFPIADAYKEQADAESVLETEAARND